MRDVRNLYDHERAKNNAANNAIEALDGDKRRQAEELSLRGQDIRELEQQRERLADVLKSTEIDRDTTKDRM